MNRGESGGGDNLDFFVKNLVNSDQNINIEA